MPAIAAICCSGVTEFPRCSGDMENYSFFSLGLAGRETVFSI
jgi:hypothetical protein